jgi:hypothetical protein
MFGTRRIRSILLFVFASLLTLNLLSGCSSSNPFGGSTTNQAAPVDMGEFNNKVGEFDDLEVPIDMKYQPGESMAIKTSSFEGGILAYKGRVELPSLKQFMITALENKQWKLVGEAQSKSTLLAFTKPSKTCMVVLEEGLGGKYGYTTATLYVTVDLAASGRLNPFGEPVSN